MQTKVFALLMTAALVSTAPVSSSETSIDAMNANDLSLPPEVEPIFRRGADDVSLHT